MSAEAGFPPPSRTIRLLLAYDGTGYHGWQRQPSQRTVQGTIEAALQRLTGQPTAVVGASRTDAGVHALGQLASFSTQAPHSDATFRRGLNALLPADIRVLEAAEAPPGFHAIGATRSKRYRYLICDRPTESPFLGRFFWQVTAPLAVDVMHRAAQSLVGRHDFLSFVTGEPQTQTTVRTIFELCVRRGRAGDAPALWATATNDPAHWIILEVAGDGFLYNMVRAITGTLVQVGQGKRPEAWVAEVLAARDRRAAGVTAPPHGLFLVSVEFDPAGGEA